MQFFQHDIGEEEIAAVAEAIRKGHITTGVVLKEFKKALTKQYNFPCVELCSSGTAALHLSLYALGIGPGDEVITTPYVGVWTSNPILMVGATPVYADINRHTYNLDPNAVAKAVTSKTKAVIPVSVNGVPVDLKGLRAVLPEHVRIIFDDIEALGSVRDGKYVGADVGTDISVGGFWVSKQVTTGGGGMVVSEDNEFLTKFEKLTRHGHGLVGDMWDQGFGFNYWMNDFCAAMGVVQVRRQPHKDNALVTVRQMLDVFFRPFRKQECYPGHGKTEFIYLIELPEGIDKRMYSDEMAKMGVPTRPYFNSLTKVPHLAKYAIHPTPVNDHVSARTIALPYHWKLTKKDVDTIATSHRCVLEKMRG